MVSSEAIRSASSVTPRPSQFEQMCKMGPVRQVPRAPQGKHGPSIGCKVVAAPMQTTKPRTTSVRGKPSLRFIGVLE
jgi:hypothetical protein